MTYRNFGEFLSQNRIERKYTVRKFAQMINISPAYLIDAEKSRCPAFDKDRLKQIAEIMQFDAEDEAVMYDLAGKTRVNGVAPDLPEYISNTANVAVALRTARDMEAGAEEWQRFIDDLKRRKG